MNKEFEVTIENKYHTIEILEIEADTEQEAYEIAMDEYGALEVLDINPCRWQKAINIENTTEEATEMTKLELFVNDMREAAIEHYKEKRVEAPEKDWDAREAKTEMQIRNFEKFILDKSVDPALIQEERALKDEAKALNALPGLTFRNAAIIKMDERNKPEWQKEYEAEFEAEQAEIRKKAEEDFAKNCMEFEVTIENAKHEIETITITETAVDAAFLVAKHKYNAFDVLEVRAVDESMNVKPYVKEIRKKELEAFKKNR